MMKENKSTTSGTTMVEVMVAFVILVLFMGIFSQAMGLAGRLSLIHISEPTRP